MENKHRGRPCKEEKLVPFHIRMNTDEQLMLLRLSKCLKVNRSEVTRMALKMTCSRLLANDDDCTEDYFEEEGEEEENFM